MTPPNHAPVPDLSVTTHSVVRVDPEILPFFLEEAWEILPEMHETLIQIDQGPGFESKHFVLLCRHFHTLKGAANSIGLTAFGGLCHEMELFCKHMDERSTKQQFNMIILAVDALKEELFKIQGKPIPKTACSLSEVTARIIELKEKKV